MRSDKSPRGDEFRAHIAARLRPLRADLDDVSPERYECCECEDEESKSRRVRVPHAQRRSVHTRSRHHAAIRSSQSRRHSRSRSVSRCRPCLLQLLLLSWMRRFGRSGWRRGWVGRADIRLEEGVRIGRPSRPSAALLVARHDAMRANAMPPLLLDERAAMEMDSYDSLRCANFGALRMERRARRPD